MMVIGGGGSYERGTPVNNSMEIVQISENYYCNAHIMLLVKIIMRSKIDDFTVLILKSESVFDRKEPLNDT